MNSSFISNDSSSSSGSPHQKRSRVEVTLCSLSGIVCIGGHFGDDQVEEKEDKEEEVETCATATVAFSGSARNMQVGSSSLCPVSGNLLVESEPLRSRYEDSGRTLLWAEWKDEEGPNYQPHCTLELRDRDPPALNVYESSNRESPKQDEEEEKEKEEQDVARSINGSSTGSADAPSLEETFDSSGSTISMQPEIHSPNRTLPALFSSSTPKNRTRSLKRRYEQLRRTKIHRRRGEESPGRSGASAIWRHTAALPEILELDVRLKSANGTEEDHGVAYLKFFGRDEEDPGTTVMDLPVRTKVASDTAHGRRRGSPGLVLTDEARLRVKVNVVPDADATTEPVQPFSSLSSSPVPPKKRVFTNSQLENHMEPVLQKIHDNEMQALEQRAAHRRAATEEANSVQGDQAAYAGCQGWTWQHMMQTLQHVVSRCDADGEAVNLFRSSASTTSTIATRQSMEL